MTPDKANLLALAARLTKAQRAALVKLDPVFTMYPVSIARVTIRRLHEKGLIAFDPPTGGFGLRVHRLTPLGLALRAQAASQ